MTQPELFVVVGPNGSGKSSAIYETQINDKIVFVNPDDIAAIDFADIADEEERNRLAWVNCNAKREALLSEGITFGFETVGSHPSKVDFMKRAREIGYKVTLLFVATEDPAINIQRIAQRKSKGGHDVPREKVISRYARTLGLLKEYFDNADDAFIWDNSTESVDASSEGMKELVRKVDGEIAVTDDAVKVKWIQNFLSNL